MKLTLITGNNRFFGQTRKPWISIDVQELCAHLQSSGIEVVEHTLSEVLNSKAKIKDSIVFYTFSQKDNIRHCIIDAMRDLYQQNNILIPSLELLNCHENKGYQVLFSQRMGIADLWSGYYSSKQDLVCGDLIFPLVLKTLTGSNGRGVFLVKDYSSLLKTIKALEPPLSVGVQIDLLRRRMFRKNKVFAGYPHLRGREDTLLYTDYITPEIPFVLQEFVPKLTCDYRVLILGSRYYAIRRLNRDSDFRASGAKRFVFDEDLPLGLLDYAKSIYHKLNNPTLALDIGMSPRGFHLFEFQAQHTGISSIVNSSGYHQFEGSVWKYYKENISYEQGIADALATYLKSNPKHSSHGA